MSQMMPFISLCYLLEGLLSQNKAYLSKKVSQNTSAV